MFAVQSSAEPVDGVDESPPPSPKKLRTRTPAAAKPAVDKPVAVEKRPRAAAAKQTTTAKQPDAKQPAKSTGRPVGRPPAAAAAKPAAASSRRNTATAAVAAAAANATASNSAADAKKVLRLAA